MARQAAQLRTPLFTQDAQTDVTLPGRVLTSQTIGVEFASKIIRVGTGAHRQRIKLQLWDTAGTERFRSVSRSYYRGAAGAILVYDLTSRASFHALPTFLHDARALASPNLTVLLAGNKSDAIEEEEGGVSYTSNLIDEDDPLRKASSPPLTPSRPKSANGSTQQRPSTASSIPLGSRQTVTVAPQGREVSAAESSRWASTYQIPVAVEVSALDGNGVEELFARLARMILTRIELGEIDPDDPASGIQYGDAGTWGEDAGSVRSGRSEGFSLRRGRRKAGTGGREWEEVFRIGSGRRSKRCC
ncbi:MAG: hypothetical protein MMC23_006180 [Stictis urceolatum]|nr:hypothetical protein [Stictis urceolata]